MQVLVAVNERELGGAGALDGEIVMPRPHVFDNGPAFVGVASLRPANRAELVELDGLDPELVSVAVADALHRLGLLDDDADTDDADLIDDQVSRMLVAA